MKKNKSQLFMQLLIMLSLLLVFPAAAYASDIQLDGSFADWEGQASMSDSYYDAFCPEDDIIKFSWATNENDDNLYFMLQNRNQHDLFNGFSHYNVHLDTSDNGQYGGNDYYLEVDYVPFWSGYGKCISGKWSPGQCIFGLLGGNRWEQMRVLCFHG